MASATVTQTFTVSGTDVRTVLGFMRRETLAIHRLLPSVPLDFDVEAVFKDIGVLSMYDYLSAVKVQIYVGDQLQREYCFRYSSSPQAASGPSADNPPTGPVPSGARMRLVVIRNPAQPTEEVDAMMQSLGWKSSTSLKRPAGSEPQTYGVHASGGFAVERQYWTKD